MKRRIGIAGQGAWGRALAHVAAEAGHDVRHWRRGEPADRLAGSDCLILAVPAQAVREVAGAIAGTMFEGQPVIIAAKGIERGTDAFLTDVAAEAAPGAAIAVMGGDQAVNIINRRDIQNAEDPAAARAALVKEYKERYEHPYIAAAKGYIDDVIDPRQTRSKIAHALEMLRSKAESLPAKKHGNIPL